MTGAIRITSDRFYRTVSLLIIGFATLAVLYPLVFIVSSSFSSGKAITSGKVWLLPVDVSLEGYKAVFEYPAVWSGYANSLFYCLFGTAISVALTLMAGYPLSKRVLHGKKLYMFIIVFTMFFSGGLIPFYLVVAKLGMVNTRWALLIPNAISVWNIIITRTYFQATIPEDLAAAAYMDGCSEIRFFLSVAIPISKAIIAVNCLYYAVGIWNTFFWGFIFLNKERLFPLQIILREILIVNTLDMQMLSGMADESIRFYRREVIKYSLIIVASLPVLCLYPFIQKYFIRGVMLGSLKG